jgi:hypothetical protein
MQPDLANRLLHSTKVSLDSHSEWGRAQRFFYHTLQSVRSQLPVVAQEQLALRGSELPSVASLEVARIVLWSSIESDQMGYTPRGAAVRATLFAFFPPEDREGPYDAVAHFCDFFSAAGLAEESLVRAFREQWPEDDA